MPQAATKLPAKTAPLAEAEADQAAARAEVEDLSAKIKGLRGEGPGFDAVEHQCLETARDAALKKLRHADLAADQRAKAEAGPLSERTISKIRRQRRKVYDLHPGVLARMAEHRRLREHRQGLENAITELLASDEYRHDRREILRIHGAAGAREDATKSGKALARLEIDLTRTITEVEIAVTVQAEASEKWQSEKSTLDAWEGAIKAHSPAARRALAVLPQPGAADDSDLVGYSDISAGPNQTPLQLHQSQKHFARPAVG